MKNDELESVTHALGDVAKELLGTLDVPAIGERIVSTLLALFGLRRAMLFELDDAAGVLVAVASRGMRNDAAVAGLRVPVDAGIPGRATREGHIAGHIVWSPDVLSDAGVEVPHTLRRVLETDGTAMVMPVPLRSRGRAVGCLTVTDLAGRRFTDEELRLLSVFADQAALALHPRRSACGPARPA